MGRPSDYTDEIAATICERIANGESVKNIVKSEDMPAESAVYRWLAAHPSFQEQYARARAVQADRMGEDILEIADDARNDWMIRNAGDTEIEVPDHEHISRSKLRVDARKWLMSKLAPKKYGDRVENVHSGELRVGRIERTIVDPANPNGTGVRSAPGSETV